MHSLADEIPVDINKASFALYLARIMLCATDFNLVSYTVLSNLFPVIEASNPVTIEVENWFQTPSLRSTSL